MSTAEYAYDLLRDLRLVESCYSRSELSAPWGLDCAANDWVNFHYLVQGRCWLATADDSRWLEQGDLVVHPHGSAHLLANRPHPMPEWIYRLPRVDKDSPTFRHGGGGEPVLMLCGGARFDPPDLPVVRLLPDLLHLPGAVTSAETAIGQTLEAMSLEAAKERPGADTIIARLCDVLVIQAVRAWLENGDNGLAGPIGAAGDEQIARAIGLMHRHPDRPWTVGSLAAAVHMSRASFSQRFSELVGTGPIAFLTRHRMELATALMRDGGLSPGEVAPRVGYGSVSAFSRAYARVTGRSPGAVRS
jgi:AraC-like DNA-binding protein